MTISDSEVKEAIPLLEQVPIFSSLKRAQLIKLAKSSVIRSFDQGETITRQGDQGVAFYLVLEGRVEVKRSNRSLAKFGRGQFFGELSVMDDHPRTADVIAIEKSKCFLLSSWIFHGSVKSNPDIALVMLKEMARRLRETDESLGDL